MKRKKHNIKGLIALFLAVVMIVGGGVFATSSRFKASTEGEETGNTEVVQVSVDTADATLVDGDMPQLAEAAEAAPVQEAEPQEIIIETQAVVETEAEAPVETEAVVVPEETEVPELMIETEFGVVPEETEETEEITETEADVKPGSSTDETEEEFFGDSDDEEETETETEPRETETEPEGTASLSVVIYGANPPANGSNYTLGETIEFAAVVTNTGDLPLSDIVLTESLTDTSAESASLQVGEATEAIYVGEYVVTSHDIEVGEISDSVIVTASDGKGHMIVGQDSVVVKTAASKPRLTITVVTTSKPANGEAYVLGETITYMIYAKNDGNLTLKNVELIDTLTDDIWNFNEDLAPGASTDEYISEYVVTEKDVKKSVVINKVTGRADCGESQKEFVVTPSEERNPTMAGEPSLYVTQVVTSTQKTYDLGDVVTFKTTVLNNGDSEVKNIEVVDDLTGEVFTIKSLKPLEKESVTSEYTVTEEDILAGNIVNQGTATGYAQDPETTGTIEVVDAASAVAEPAEINKSISISDEVVGGKDIYQIGDTITHQITITNNGNITQNITISGLMNGITGAMSLTGGTDCSISDNVITVSGLKPGESRVITCIYTITSGDAGHKISVTPTASNGDIDVKDPVKKPVIIIEKPVEYVLTINYIYADGTAAAPAYQGSFPEGAMVPEILSPQIPGFVPQYSRIVGFAMPAQNLTFSIVYASIQDDPVIDETTEKESEGSDSDVETIGLPGSTDDDDDLPDRSAQLMLDEDGNYILSEIQDSKVPLGDRSGFDQYFCILHWILALAAAAVLVTFFFFKRSQDAKLASLTEKIQKELEDRKRK